MSNNNHNFNRNFKKSSEKNNTVFGIENFKKKLEKEFFSVVNININTDTNCNNVLLIIEAECNFSLVQGLSFLGYRNTANLNFKNNYKSNFIFLNALEQLKSMNTKKIDIEEVNILFTDTTVIISKIHENSIANQFGNLLLELYKHHKTYVPTNSKMPYEIHIPIYEECPSINSGLPTSIGIPKNTHNAYYHYWGLYFEDDIDSKIYDFWNTTVIDGELKMI